jgi:uncharacterized linocin/CFP29 family protein
MTTDNPQVPWTDEQWARVNQVVQEEASRARVAATFLPLIGPLPGDTDFVRRENIVYPALPAAPPPPMNQIAVNDRTVIQLATLQVTVPVRGAQMVDPEMTSVLALFRRAANVLARLEDAAVFRGLIPDLRYLPQIRFRPVGGLAGPGVGLGQEVWEITGGQTLPGLLHPTNPLILVIALPPVLGNALVPAVSQAIGILEGNGHFGPFALVLGDNLFLAAQTPTGALVLPQDRIIPFLGGGSLLRSSTLPNRAGVMVALGGTPVELIVATDVCLQFLQLTVEPVFVFRVCEKMVLRVKERSAIVTILAL